MAVWSNKLSDWPIHQPIGGAAAIRAFLSNRRLSYIANFALFKVTSSIHLAVTLTITNAKTTPVKVTFTVKSTKVWK